MKDTAWIKDLVLAEQEMEEKGMIDVSFSSDESKNLERQSIEFLRDLRVAFNNTCEAFNEMKGQSSTIKIYGISNTVADFMLFRNGHKIIFSYRQAGVISVSSSQMTSVYVPGQEATHFDGIDHILKAKWGPFEELIWTYNGNLINIDHLVRFYTKLFARNSVR